jgi:hypothetical protein
MHKFSDYINKKYFRIPLSKYQVFYSKSYFDLKCNLINITTSYAECTNLSEADNKNTI